MNIPIPTAFLLILLSGVSVLITWEQWEGTSTPVEQQWECVTQHSNCTTRDIRETI